MVITKVGTEEEVQQKLEGAMAEVNRTLALNVEVGIDTQFGGNYAEVH